MTDTIEQIKQRLTKAFSPSELKIIDNSEQHRNHAGNISGGGHYSIFIQANVFENKSRLESHRMIYEQLGDLMKNEIHALSLKINN